MDKYKSFNALASNEKQGLDYDICVREGSSGVVIMAPHGGGIEPGTMDLADSVAGKEHTFYCFKGLKKEGNNALHITSDHFDEPKGVKLVENSVLVLVIHGCMGKEDSIYVGGKNLEFKKSLLISMSQAGLHAKESLKPGLRGIKSTNICNRGLTGTGVQIEVSEGLRKKMFKSLSHGIETGKTEIFNNTVAAIRTAISKFKQ